jgi:hypothetical protein
MELFIAYIDIDGRYLHIKLQLSRRELGGVDRTNAGICKYERVAVLELGFQSTVSREFFVGNLWHLDYVLILDVFTTFYFRHTPHLLFESTL